MALRLTARLFAAAFAALVLAAAPGPCGEKPHPIAAQVKAALKGAEGPFTMLVRLQVKEGEGKRFEAAFAKALKPTRAEKGCRAYELNRDAAGAGRYVLYERWRSLPALEAHLKSAHITALLGEVGELLDGAPKVDVLQPAGE